MSSKPVSSNPIALPQHQKNTDYPMADGSYPSSGPFNPASYTRHFLGSPVSWRPSSFGARFSVASSSPQLLSSVDPNVKLPDSSLLNALNVFDREGELCRNYTCCGMHLTDLHALLEHFEEVHIVVRDPSASQPQAHLQVPFNPVAHSPNHQLYPTPFDPDDMELELDLDNSTQPPPSSDRSSPSSDAASLPDTPISTPRSAFPLPHSPYVSRPSSPGGATPARHVSPNRVNLNLNLNLSAFQLQNSHNHPLPRPEEAFNAYARFSSDYSSCLPGAQFNCAAVDEAQWQGVTRPLSGSSTNEGQCVPPALLFGTTRASSPSQPERSLRNPPSNSVMTSLPSQLTSQETGSHTPTCLSTTASAPPTPSSSRAHSNIASSLLLNKPSSLLLSKPFRCPKPNCNKSYKQANGLKYHMTHGSCNFAPPKDLEHVKDLLERKRRDRVTADGGGANSSNPSTPVSAISSNSLLSPLSATSPNSPYDLTQLTETELREVELEAERRLRPFACGVGDCQRRYKNMNGLRYHYQHSGDHGAVGLALLASGQHGCLSARRGAQTNSNSHQSPGTFEEREGRKRISHELNAPRGSMSVPVSRAPSVAPVVRAGINGTSVIYGGTAFVGSGLSRAGSLGGGRFGNLGTTSVGNSAASSCAQSTVSSRAGTPQPVNSGAGYGQMEMNAMNIGINGMNLGMPFGVGKQQQTGMGYQPGIIMTMPLQVLTVPTANISNHAGSEASPVIGDGENGEGQTTTQVAHAQATAQYSKQQQLYQQFVQIQHQR